MNVNDEVEKNLQTENIVKFTKPDIRGTRKDCKDIDYRGDGWSRRHGRRRMHWLYYAVRNLAEKLSIDEKGKDSC